MLKLTGKLTIQRASELAASIGQAIAGEEHAVVLDLAAVTSVDVTFLQILCAAHHSARRDGKTLSIVSPSEALLRAANTAGFERKQPCSKCAGDICIWQAKQAA